MTEHQSVQRGKELAVAAAISPNAWERVHDKRLTSGPLEADSRHVDYRYYDAAVDTVSYRKGDKLIIFRVYVSDPRTNFEMHTRFVDVTMRRDTLELLGMWESLYP